MKCAVCKRPTTAKCSVCKTFPVCSTDCEKSAKSKHDCAAILQGHDLGANPHGNAVQMMLSEEGMEDFSNFNAETLKVYSKYGVVEPPQKGSKMKRKVEFFLEMLQLCDAGYQGRELTFTTQMMYNRRYNNTYKHAVDTFSPSELKKLHHGMKSRLIGQAARDAHAAQSVPVAMEPVTSAPKEVTKIHYVTVNTIGFPSADISKYEEGSCRLDTWQDKILKDPSICCYKSPFAELCGLNLKIYYKKSRPGLGELLKNDPFAHVPSTNDVLASNNGAATFLCVKPSDGISDIIICGSAYVVLDDGRTILKRDVVWGIQEMVNCAMDIYDMDPQNRRRGNATVTEWSRKYRQRRWSPHSGTGKINIYSGLD